MDSGLAGLGGSLIGGAASWLAARSTLKAASAEAATARQNEARQADEDRLRALLDVASGKVLADLLAIESSFMLGGEGEQHWSGVVPPLLRALEVDVSCLPHQEGRERLLVMIRAINIVDVATRGDRPSPGLAPEITEAMIDLIVALRRDDDLPGAGVIEEYVTMQMKRRSARLQEAVRELADDS